MTRGFHSKNATFSIRNYNTGALLYYKHICQRGRDALIDEELYKGTSKSAEGYSARELLQTAKQEGLNIAIHWQDANSSSSKSVKETFPDMKVMICGGHAGRAHNNYRVSQKRKASPTSSKKSTESSSQKLTTSSASVKDTKLDVGASLTHCVRGPEITSPIFFLVAKMQQSFLSVCKP